MSEFETKEIPVGDRVVQVASLPADLRDAVTFFDRVNKDLADASYKQSVLAVAATAWKNKIMTDVQEYMKLVDEAQTKAQEAEGPTEEVAASFPEENSDG